MQSFLVLSPWDQNVSLSRHSNVFINWKPSTKLVFNRQSFYWRRIT